MLNDTKRCKKTEQTTQEQNNSKDWKQQEI